MFLLDALKRRTGQLSSPLHCPVEFSAELKALLSAFLELGFTEGTRIAFDDSDVSRPEDLNVFAALLRLGCTIEDRRSLLSTTTESIPLWECNSLTVEDQRLKYSLLLEAGQKAMLKFQDLVSSYKQSSAKGKLVFLNPGNFRSQRAHSFSVADCQKRAAVIAQYLGLELGKSMVNIVSEFGPLSALGSQAYFLAEMMGSSIQYLQKLSSDLTQNEALISPFSKSKRRPKGPILWILGDDTAERLALERQFRSGDFVLIKGYGDMIGARERAPHGVEWIRIYSLTEGAGIVAAAYIEAEEDTHVYGLGRPLRGVQFVESSESELGLVTSSGEVAWTGDLGRLDDSKGILYYGRKEQYSGLSLEDLHAYAKRLHIAEHLMAEHHWVDKVLTLSHEAKGVGLLFFLNREHVELSAKKANQIYMSYSTLVHKPFVLNELDTLVSRIFRELGLPIQLLTRFAVASRSLPRGLGSKMQWSEILAANHSEINELFHVN